MPVLSVVMNMPTPLLKSQPPPTPKVDDTSIRIAGPEGNPFYNIHWLAKEDRKPNTNPQSYPCNKHGPSSSPKALVPNHRDALQAHMHLLHKLGNAKNEANYHAYYQTLKKDGTAYGAASNAYLTSSDLPFMTKCVIMKYRTDTLYNQSSKTCGIVQTLNKSNLPPLPTSRQCPTHPFWVPTHTNKEHDH